MMTRRIHPLSVLPGAAILCTGGAARGDVLGIADDLVMDDIYQLRPDAARRRLLAAADKTGALSIAPGSEAGRPGRDLVLDACLTLMDPGGRTAEMLLLVEIEDQSVAEIWALPLAPLEPRLDLRLVGLDRHAATSRLAQAASQSFARGTRITMAGGEQQPVEELRAGDRVLTRDDGPQPLRWVGSRTLRATGAFAPVVIAKGALHNAAELVLSPDLRVLVYQRQDRLGAGRAEVMVKARHLINNDSVRRREGGFVDYFQLVFDAHQIIFAEGIAVESLLVDPLTRAVLPSGMDMHAPRRHLAYELQDSLLPRADLADLLRRASSAG
jgi:hypothetical protein